MLTLLVLFVVLVPVMSAVGHMARASRSRADEEEQRWLEQSAATAARSSGARGLPRRDTDRAAAGELATSHLLAAIERYGGEDRPTVEHSRQREAALSG